MSAPYPAGTVVTIINRTLGGKYFVEGRAEIVQHLYDDRYHIKFLSNGRVFTRPVDPAAQDDPQGFVEILNQKTGHDGDHDQRRSRRKK